MNNNKHILFLCSWYPNKYEPTIGNFVRNHAWAVAQRCKVSVLYAHPDITTKDFAIEKQSFENLHEYLVYYPKKKRKDRVINRFKAYQKGFSEIVKEQGNIDIVHLHVVYPAGLYAYYLKELKGIPYVITFHWSGFLKESDLFNKLSPIKKALNIYIARKARRLLPISKKLKKALKSCGISGEMKVVYNAIDTHLFRPAEKTNKPKKRLLHVSNLKEMKNVSGIIKATTELWEKRKDFVLTIVCEENYEHMHKSVEMGNSKNFIEVLPAMSQQELAKVMQESDIYIHFSNYETFGLTMFEAISTGLPVITTNTGLVEEINVEKFGKIVIKNNIEDLKSKINWMLNNYEMYNKQAMHSFVADKFSYEEIGKKYCQIYNEIIS